MFHRMRLGVALLVGIAALAVLSGCRSFAPGVVVISREDPAARRLTFSETSIRWRVADEELTISFPVRELGWTALVFDGDLGYRGADVILVRTTLAGTELLDCHVARPFSATPDPTLGGADQLRLVEVSDGRAVVTKPLTGDDWDLTLSPGSVYRLALVEGLLGVDTFDFLRPVETEIEL